MQTSGTVTRRGRHRSAAALRAASVPEPSTNGVMETSSLRGQIGSKLLHRRRYTTNGAHEWSCERRRASATVWTTILRRDWTISFWISTIALVLTSMGTQQGGQARRTPAAMTNHPTVPCTLPGRGDYRGGASSTHDRMDTCSYYVRSNNQRKSTSVRPAQTSHA